MESQISDEIIKVLDALCDKFGIVINWSSENIIPYTKILLHKCISFEIATSIYWIIMACVIGIGGIILCTYGYRTNKKYKKYLQENEESDCDHSDGWTFIIIGFVLLLVFTCVAGHQIYDLIQCYTFPELILFQQIQNLLN